MINAITVWHNLGQVIVFAALAHFICCHPNPIIEAAQVPHQLCGFTIDNKDNIMMTQADFVMAEIRRLTNRGCSERPIQEPTPITIQSYIVAEQECNHISQEQADKPLTQEGMLAIEHNLFEERLGRLEAEVQLLREAVGNLINIMRRAEANRMPDNGTITRQVVNTEASYQPEPVRCTKPDKLVQLNDEIPYKLVGQLFRNEDGAKAKVPVFKLEFLRKGQSAGGKDKGKKYLDVHCGLYVDYGHAQLQKSIKMPSNQKHKADIKWISHKLTQLYDEATDNGTLEHTAAGFFHIRKTQEILHHVIVQIDLETFSGRLMFNFGDELKELPFTMARPKDWQRSMHSADLVYYFNVKDVRKLFMSDVGDNSDDNQGDDYDDEQSQV